MYNLPSRKALDSKKNLRLGPRGDHRAHSTATRVSNPLGDSRCFLLLGVCVCEAILALSWRTSAPKSAYKSFQDAFRGLQEAPKSLQDVLQSPQEAHREAPSAR